MPVFLETAVLMKFLFGCKHTHKQNDGMAFESNIKHINVTQFINLDIVPLKCIKTVFGVFYFPRRTSEEACLNLRHWLLRAVDF